MTQRKTGLIFIFPVKRKKSAQTPTILNLPPDLIVLSIHKEMDPATAQMSIHELMRPLNFNPSTMIRQLAQLPPSLSVSLKSHPRLFLNTKIRYFSHMVFTRQTPNPLGCTPVPFPLTNGTAE